MCLPRLAPTSADLVADALPWLVCSLGELGAIPPPGFVIDAALMLAGAPLDTSSAQRVEHARLQDALARYEDRVLGRLAADRHLQAVRDAFATLSQSDRAAAIGIIVAALVGRAKDLMSVEAGVLRKLSRRNPQDVVALGFEAWREEPDVLDALAGGYESLCNHARSVSSLLSDGDVFTLENLEALGEMGQRVAIAQVVNAAEALARTWPRRVKIKRRDHGPAPTALEDESVYPAGGFTSVSNVGTLENLVTSELVYMSSPDERSGHVDLFDVRYAEGELLYYTRDEALIVRPRRLIAFVFHPSLEGARLKDAGVPWQRIVLMMAWMLASVRSLARWLGESELRFLCIFEHADKAYAGLARERQLVELLLAEWRDKGMAEVTTLTREGWTQRLCDEAGRADVRVTVLGEEEVESPHDRVICQSMSARGRDWHGWCQEGLEVLRALV